MDDPKKALAKTADTIPECCNSDFKSNKAMVPIQKVMINWLMLATMVNETALMRFPSFIYSARPT